MVSTAEGVQLIAAETGRLKGYVSGTDAEEWSLDSPCEGWTVGDVIGHLGWAAEFFADAISQ
ncbi:MAG: maleylpyruvate isomerase N-terminal domain-containing protein, partial [Chloroflexota bacterium]|nr:maleylpyruvate isomerase N-terminal domain-containing protein [Chloroflexota bacterium]